MSICLSPARAEMSRRNGAKSHGPKTPDGKARSARNALKDGLCAQEHVVLAREDAQAFAALEIALMDELAPEGALQRILAGRIVRAAWRLERAERIEAGLFAHHNGDGDLALALIRDGNGTRAFDTLLRYRGSALAELFRSLRLLRALQDEARAIVVPARAVSRQEPNEPKARREPCEPTAILVPEPGIRPRPSARSPEQTKPGAATPLRDGSTSRAQPSRSTP